MVPKDSLKSCNGLILNEILLGMFFLSAQSTQQQVWCRRLMFQYAA